MKILVCSLLIIPLLLSGCGSGTTEEFPNIPNTEPGPSLGPTGRQVFVSQMFNNNNPIVTREGGNVNVFSNPSGNFTAEAWYFGDSVTQQNQNIQQRQAYGHQRANSGVATATDYFGIVINAPANGSLNISSSTHIILQTGNGRPTSGDFSSSISHMIFTIDLISDSTNNEVITCSADLQLQSNDRMFDSTGVNHYGLHTFTMPLESFNNCDQGGLEDILPTLHRVAVKVVGGKDAIASSTFGGGESAALIQVGWIAFSNMDSAAVVDDSSDHLSMNKLFASQIIVDSSSTRTLESGDVVLFSDADFALISDSFGTTAEQINDNIRQRQAYGIERGNSSPVSSDSSFGISINAPNNGSINVEPSSMIVLQMGNGSFSADGYNILSIELSNGNAWCRVNQDVSSIRPADPLPVGINQYGLSTYEIALSSFLTCSGGNISDILSTLSNVSIKAIASENPIPASSSNTNTLIHVGWIAFK